MRGYNLSISKLALISTLTAFLIGFSMASSLETASEEEEVTSGEVNVNLEQESLSDYNSVEIGLWSNKHPKEKNVKTVEELVKGRASPGTNIELGLVLDSDDDGTIDLGDEVKFYDNGEDEIDYSSNPGFQAYRSPNSLTKVSVPTEVAGSYGLQRSDEFEIVKDANPGDTVELVRNEDNIFTKEVDLSEYIDRSGEVTLVSSERKTDMQDPELRLYVDLDSPEIVSAEKISSKEGKFQFTVSDEGEASIDESSIGNVKENFEFEFYSATEGIENVKQSVEGEKVVFEVTLKKPLKNADRITVSNGDSKLKDSVGNVIQSSQATVDNMNGRKPEINTEFTSDINEPIVPGEEIELSVTAKDVVEVTEIEANLIEFGAGVRDLELEEVECTDSAEGIRCFEAETSFEFSGGENPSATITATDKNGNTGRKDTETLEAKLNFEGLNSITVQDNSEEIGIDTAIVDFKENIGPSTVSAEDWILKHPDGRKAFDSANVIDTDKSKIKLTMDDTPSSTTDSDDVDVVYEPGDNPLRGAEGFLIPRISMNDRDDIDEIDDAGPALLKVEAIEGHKFGVLKFSEPVKNVESDSYSPKVITISKGQKTSEAIIEFNNPGNTYDGVLEFKAKDIQSKGKDPISRTSAAPIDYNSDKIPLKEGDHIISTPNENSYAELKGETWIDSAFNYEGDWVSAENVTANQGTYMKVDRAGYLELKETNNLPSLPGDLDSEWNLLSPFLLNGNPTGLFNDQVCEDELQVINPETQQEEDDVECNSEGEIGLSVNSVFNGYWVTDPQ